MSNQNEQKYFLEIIRNSDNSPNNYYITKGYLGHAVMIISPTSRKEITQKGWVETKHKGLQNVEISSDQNHVLVYSIDQKEPLKLEIPSDVDSSNFAPN